jgi:uncharacterized protein
MSRAELFEEPLQVTLSDDRLSAYLKVEPSDGEQLSIRHVLEKLASAHVSFGIDQEHLQEALERPGTTVQVATGRPPVDGSDGAVEFAPDLLTVGGRPHVAEDGEVDLFDLGLVHNVTAGAVLATVTPPTAGDPGMDVLGRMLRPRGGRDVHIRPGPGCQWSEDHDQLLASIGGHATLVGETISVSAIYRVRGNVGPATGNIDFLGSVVVTGDVLQGYQVKAGGDVEIQGSVESGEVEAGGSVSVRYGIRGHARVCVAGTVRARFIEFAEVRADCSVYATDGVVCGVVEAGEDVDVLGRHGSIIGGRVVAGHSIRVGELGSSRGVATEVHVGSAPKLLAEAQAHKTLLGGVTDRLQIVQDRLAVLQGYAREGRLNESGKRALVQHHETYRTLLDQRAELQSRQAELLERLREVNKASVSVRNVCHVGVRVAIGGISHMVEQELEGVCFQRDERSYTIELVSR